LTIGEIIQQKRKQANLTQIQLGNIIGLEGRSGEVTIQRWEHDRVSPTVKYLRPLCRALHCTLEELIPRD
jgi:transcriptional regulator with XRE-family HTH domain